MLLHQLGDGCVDEHQLPDYVGHVDLVSDLVAGINISLHPGPVGVDPDQVEEGLDVAEQEVAEVVGLGGDLSPFVVEHDLLGQTHLIGLLGVGAHDEDEADDGADQSPHVGEVGVQLVEGPLVGGSPRRFPEDNLGIGKVGSLDVRRRAHQLRYVLDSLFVKLSIGEKALVGFNDILLNISKPMDSQLRTKPKIILVSNVEFLVGGTFRVDVCVYQRNDKHKLTQTGLHPRKNSVVHAGGVGCCVTAVHQYFELFVKAVRYFAFNCECVAQGRAKCTAHSQPVEIGLQFLGLSEMVYRALDQGY